MAETKKRFKEIDIAKGLTISLVVLGHTQAPLLLNHNLAAFRMPLFFLITGYLLNIAKHKKDKNGFVKTRFWSLIIPYFTIGIVFYLLWIVRRKLGFGETDTSTNGIVGLLIGNRDFLFFNVPLWFLITLFCATNIFFFLMLFLENKPFVIKAITVVFIGIIGALIGEVLMLPWGIDIALAVQPFLFLGNLLKQYNFFTKFSKNISVTLIFCLLYFILANTNIFVDISKRNYGNLIFFYLAGISGSVFILQIIYFIKKIKGLEKIFTFIGTNSINVLTFHFGVFLMLNLISKVVPYISDTNWVLYWLLGVFLTAPLGLIFKKNPFFNSVFNGKVPYNKKIKKQLI